MRKSVSSLIGDYVLEIERKERNSLTTVIAKLGRNHFRYPDTQYLEDKSMGVVMNGFII